MSVQQFGSRLQAVTDAHMAAHGTLPSPHAALSAALVTPPDQASSLFAPPAQSAATAALALHPAQNDKQFLDAFQHAVSTGGYEQFVNENEDRIKQLQSDPILKGRTNGIIGEGAFMHASGVKQPSADTYATGHVSTAQEQGLAPEKLLKQGWGVLGSIAGEATLGLGQVVSGLVHSPGGLYALATGAGADVFHAGQYVGSGGQEGSPDFQHTSKIAKGVASGIARDVTNPGANPGNLFLDVLGFGSAGVGTAARIGRAARAASEGESALAALRAPHPLQTATLSVGDYTETIPLSQNPLVAFAQKYAFGKRQEWADARAEGNAPLSSIVLPVKAQKFLDDHLSFERKVGREADARLRVEHSAMMTLENQLRIAAGSSIAHSRVVSYLQKHMNINVVSDLFGNAVDNAARRKGLTRGEQKAIQSASWDVPGDIYDKIAAEEQTHRDLIDMSVGSKLAHKRQIADLSLARAALKNPSARFQKAFDLTQQLVAETERLKIENLGLAPLTAEGRVAKAGAAIQNPEIVAERVKLEGGIGKLKGLIASQEKRGEVDPKLTERLKVLQDRHASLPDPLAEAAAAGKQSETSFYLPLQPRGKVKRAPSQVRGRFSVSAGPYGLPPGRDLPELTHEFTAKSILAGNYRIDATNLAAESYARTVRAITVRNQWQKLWDAADITKQNEHQIPIRDVNSISDALREIVAKLDEGYLTAKDADALPPDIRKMTDELYPDEKNLKPEEMDHVRWIDSRLIGGLEGAPGASAKTLAGIFQAVNAPVRFTTLYLRPAYALNLLGNHAMLVFDQGFLNSGVNLARALRVEATDGAANAEKIRHMVGAGKSRSYVASQSGHLAHDFARFWNNFADRDERVASFLYYADRKGYKTPEQRDVLLNSDDAAVKADLSEVTRRANKALVEFDNMTPFEKNVLRHVIFVYPWVRGATVWTLRSILEHPMKADLLDQLGQEEIKDDPILKNAPAWFKRIGYFPVGWNKNGTPMVVNPTSINTPSTLSDVYNAGRSLVAGDRTASLSDLFGPAIGFGIHASTGRDQYGNKYPGSSFMGAAAEVLAGLPQLAPSNRKAAKPVKPFDVRHRGSLEAHINSLIHQTVFGPGWLDGYGSLIVGGLSPKPMNPGASKARGLAELPTAQRIQWEKKLINLALGAQGDFLGKPVPPEIRQTVNDSFVMTKKLAAYSKETGRGATPKEKAGFWIDYLSQKGRFSPDEAIPLHAQLKKLADDQIAHFQTALLDKYAHGKEIRQWDSDVRALYSFKKETFNEKAAALFAQGLSPQRSYNVPQKALDDYGRGFLKFQDEVRAATKRGASPDELRVIADENNDQVHGFPSYTALAWSHQTPEEQQAARARLAGRGWKTLTAFEKNLLGNKSTVAVTAGWQTYDKIAKAYRSDGSSLDAAKKNALARVLDKSYPGFYKDFLYSQLPTVERFKRTPLYTSLPDRAEFDKYVTTIAEATVAAIKKNGHASYYNRVWRNYVAADIDPWLASHPALHKTVNSFGKSFLNSLVLNG